MVAGHLHAVIQPEASALGTSFWRRFQAKFHLPQSTLQAILVMVGTAQAGTSVGEWTSGKANYEK